MTSASRVRLWADQSGELFLDDAPVFIGNQESLLQRIRHLSRSKSPQLVITLNVDQILNAQASEHFRRVVKDASFRTLDGAPVVAVAKAMGLWDARRNTGADMLPATVAATPPLGRILILGGAPGVAAKAVERLSAQHPEADIVSLEFPRVNDATDRADPALQQVVSRVSELAPSVVFICLGSPKQEFWFEAWRQELPPAVYIGAGAAVDFAAGIRSRAPELVQRIGMEWVWRLIHEPQRLAKRYLIKGPAFFPLAARWYFSRRNTQSGQVAGKHLGVDKGANIFVSWCRFHGRSEGLARALGISGYFIDGGNSPAPIRYWRQWRQTRILLKLVQPSKIILMQPPVIALWCVAWLTRQRRTPIAGDLHTGVFDDPKWTWATKMTLRILARRGLAVVTNEALAQVADTQKASSLVLHDLAEKQPRDLSEFADPRLTTLLPDGFALVPLAYAHDEPLGEILSAARLLPEVRWALTGNPPDSVRKAAPSNVLFTGFVSGADFVRLMSRAAVVCAITRNENTMQRAAYEALNMGRPLVTSDTTVLRQYYQGAAALVQPTAHDLARGVSQSMADPEAASQMETLRDAKLAEQEATLAKLSTWLNN